MQPGMGTINGGITMSEPKATYETLREAIEEVKNLLREMDVDRVKKNEFYKEVNQEPHNFGVFDELYLMYRKDYGEEFCIFEDNHDIDEYLANVAWDDWDLWEYDDIQGFLDEDVIIWKFYRNERKEKYPNLHGRSKKFIDGWQREQVSAAFEVVPSFTV